MNNLIFNIKKALKINPPAEIERKFLIDMPNLQNLEQTCKRIDMHQTYLCTDEQKEMRIRKKSCGGKTKYVFTKKYRITDETRIEEEKEITKDQYSELTKKADLNCRTIQKTRYTLGYAGKTFEIDIYPFWKNVAVMEIELDSELETIKFPQDIEIIGEVTNNKNFKNSNIARCSDETLQNIVNDVIEEMKNYEKTIF